MSLVRQIFIQYRTRQYRCRISATKISYVAPTYVNNVYTIGTHLQQISQILYCLLLIIILGIVASRECRSWDRCSRNGCFRNGHSRDCWCIVLIYCRNECCGAGAGAEAAPTWRNVLILLGIYCSVAEPEPQHFPRGSQSRSFLSLNHNKLLNLVGTGLTL
jgi:hypothetical protein